jgi:hypothetical protein
MTTKFLFSGLYAEFVIFFFREQLKFELFIKVLSFVQFSRNLI